MVGIVFGKPSLLAKAFDYTPFNFSLPLFPSKYYSRSRAQFALNGKRHIQERQPQKRNFLLSLVLAFCCRLLFYRSLVVLVSFAQSSWPKPSYVPWELHDEFPIGNSFDGDMASAYSPVIY